MALDHFFVKTMVPGMALYQRANLWNAHPCLLLKMASLMTIRLSVGRPWLSNAFLDIYWLAKAAFRAYRMGTGIAHSRIVLR
jgi:hypothetical protein